jgi:hypothetical protein
MTCSVPMAIASPMSGSTPPPPKRGLCGTWKRDMEKTDIGSMNLAFTAMKLGKFQKLAALKLIDGLEIDYSTQSNTNTKGEEEVKLRYLTKLPGITMEERYKRGHNLEARRRDQRKGHQYGKVEELGRHEMKLAIWWEGELPGKVTEHFAVTSDGGLDVNAVFYVGGEKICIRQHYQPIDQYD